MNSSRKLKVFLCHAVQDKPVIRELYAHLKNESWIYPWFDEEDLLAGQNWDFEITRALHEMDAIVICLSKLSVKKEGYVQKEIKRALDIAEEKPEGSIYIIPLRLDECDIPLSLKNLHWVDYFNKDYDKRLFKALKARAESLEIQITGNKVEVSNSESVLPTEDLDLYKFIEIPKTEEVPYTFYIGKYPVTNAQYERFLNAPDFANPVYWLEFPKFDENCKRIGDWGQEGLNWVLNRLGKDLLNRLDEKLKKLTPMEYLEELKKNDGLLKELITSNSSEQFIRSNSSNVLYPQHWENKEFGKINSNHPVVGISWYEANAYCEWLFQNWDVLSESKMNSSLKPQSIRLPLEIEWQKATGVEGRFVWDEKGKETTSLKEILRRANIKESGIGKTTPVNAYPLGKSPYNVMDMCGNVQEWQANYSGGELSGKKTLPLRGGSWNHYEILMHVQNRSISLPSNESNNIGFRMVALPNG